MVATTLLLMLAVGVAGDNLLKNSSFEASRAQHKEWDSDLGAQTRGGTEESVVRVDDEVAHDGKYSLRFEGSASVGKWRMVSQTVKDIEAGRRYVLSGWIKTEGVRQLAGQYLNCNLFVQFLDEAGKVIPAAGGAPVFGTRPRQGTSAWSLIEESLQAPARATAAKVGCFMSCNGKAWFDDVQFRAPPPVIWKTVDGERAIYYWESGAGPNQREIDANQEHQEKLEQLLGVKLDQPVRYFKYRNPAHKGELTGQAGNAHATGENEIHSVFWLDRHEIVHLLTRAWGSPNALLGEGIAVYLSGGWHGRPVDEYPPKFKEEGRLVELRFLVRTGDFRSQSDLVTYPLSGSFVKYLTTQYGIPAFRQLYGQVKVNPWPHEFDIALKANYQKDLAQLEQEWLTAVRAH